MASGTKAMLNGRMDSVLLIEGGTDLRVGFLIRFASRERIKDGVFIHAIEDKQSKKERYLHITHFFFVFCYFLLCSHLSFASLRSQRGF